jgi:hypothetical protein
LQGKRVPAELRARGLAWRAEGLGIRATARVLAVDPNTVLPWVGEAAAQLRACARYLLCDGHVMPLQLDELSAGLRDLTTGEISEGDALERLAPSRPWGWTAMEPASTVLLAREVGPRTLELAQRVVHHVGGV